MSSKKKAEIKTDELRRRGKEIDRENIRQNPENMDALSPEAGRRMLNELQTHQIELEMQNEELRRTKDELAAAKEHYFNFYNLAPVGYLTLNENSLIVEANHTMATWLGIAKNQLVGQPLTRFICREDQDHYYLCNKQLFATGKAKPCELRLVNKSGAPFWIRIEATRVFGDNDTSHCNAVISDISERNKVEEELRKSEEKFRYLTENSSDVIWHLNSDYRFDYISQADERMRGYKQCEVIGETVWSFLKPEGIELVKKEHAKRLAEEQSGIRTRTICFELEQLCKDGSWIWIEVHSTAHHDSSGKLIGLHGVTRDITERKRSEKTLCRSAEIQAVLKEIAEAAVLVPSMDELYRAVHRLVGRVLPEKLFHINLLDEAINEIVVPFMADDMNFIPSHRPLGKGMTEYIMGLGRTTYITPDEMDRLTKAGKYNLSAEQKEKVRHYLGAPLIDSKGKPFGVMVLIQMGENESFQHQDIEFFSIIAAQVSMAIERKKFEEAITAERNLLLTLINSIPDRIYVKDRECRFTLNNISHLNALGTHSQSEVLGKTDHDFRPAILADEYFADDQKVMESDKPLYDCEKPTRLPSGQTGILLVNKVPLHNAKGDVIGLIGTSRDISERKQAEDAVRCSQDRYHTLINQSFEGLALIDIQTLEVVEVNRRFTEMFGYSLPEDAPFYVNIFSTDSKEMLHKRYASLKNQQVLQIETRKYLHKNGSLVFAERAGTLVEIDGRKYLLASLRDVTTERRRQKELMQDIEFARRVQRELLPELPESPLVTIRTIYNPSKNVSGDSYYMEWRKKGKILRVFLIDITGHGLATALQTASINALLKETSTTRLTLLEQMCQINKRAAKYFSEGSYAAIIGFEMDFAAMELRYVGAGITQFYVNGKKIETPGMFVGMLENAEFNAGAISISECDCVYFLTDGFTDRLAQPENENFWSPSGKEFDADVAALEELASKGDLKDDATGLCFRINGRQAK